MLLKISEISQESNCGGFSSKVSILDVFEGPGLTSDPFWLEVTNATSILVYDL